MALKIAQFINIMLFALVMGVMWGTWFSLARSLPVITPETFLEVGRVMISNLALPMSVLMPVALLSTLPVLFWLYRQASVVALYLAVFGLVLFGVVIAITLLVNVPLDNQIRQWTLHSLPGEWQTLRSRWELFHTMRTISALAALGAMVASSLVSGWRG